MNGEQHIRKKGEQIHIPINAFHCYENASTTENLVISFRLDKANRAVEESFFRNFFGYIDDVRKAGQQPSIFQIFRFLCTIDAPLAIPVLGAKTHWVSRQVSWMVMVFVGIIVGEWLLGYKGSYAEYCSGSKDKDK